ncbi:molybdopterin/thiamine biosynthesis adenylyltransferase [Rhodoligotrophos appendicifer]|uniref:HesA/MoeB/ThiF family protein n=1 Tax=Rhodoligotrophos appendicifer TaxID=987056 RepID=UPI0011812AC0|nr:molybdopterin-synthase adenylyltransferase MoeB [Rhodoligotrophos appendicifer]
MRLTDDELERYSRHILLKEVGGPGQQRLKSAQVLVIGAGGLGAPVLLYLAAAGIGTLGIVDDDTVSLSNLQRQIIHDTPGLGSAKTESAAAAIRRLNPGVAVRSHRQRLTADNALALVTDYHIVADGSDNFETRSLVADACEQARIPLVSAAVGRFDGQITTFKPHERRPDGSPYPTYRSLYPEAPAPGSMPSCDEVGIIGALTGIIGSMQALEVIKEILGIGDSLAGRLLMYDALGPRIYEARI